MLTLRMNSDVTFYYYSEYQVSVGVRVCQLTNEKTRDVIIYTMASSTELRNCDFPRLGLHPMGALSNDDLGDWVRKVARPSSLGWIWGSAF